MAELPMSPCLRKHRPEASIARRDRARPCDGKGVTGTTSHLVLARLCPRLAFGVVLQLHVRDATVGRRRGAPQRGPRGRCGPSAAVCCPVSRPALFPGRLAGERHGAAHTLAAVAGAPAVSPRGPRRDLTRRGDPGVPGLVGCGQVPVGGLRRPGGQSREPRLRRGEGLEERPLRGRREERYSALVSRCARAARPRHATAGTLALPRRHQHLQAPLPA